jgi:hypothetical protein
MRVARRSVPPGPILGAIVMSALAFTLIGVIIARSPYTHHNLNPEGYDRTEVATLGDTPPFEGISVADAALTTGDPFTDGRILFFANNCASCHGLTGQGATVGGDLDTSDLSPSEFLREVRKGPKGMPAFIEESLSDEELERLYAFLDSVGQEGSE